jgi:hypothetical protein
MFVLYNLGIIFRYIVKLSFDKKTFYIFFIMYSSTWNVNVFKVQIHFMFINNDVQRNSTISIIIITT